MQVRKLEFLLADAKIKGHDCVVTVGGIQSNHCRATAVAARWAGAGGSSRSSGSRCNGSTAGVECRKGRRRSRIGRAEGRYTSGV